MMSPCSTNKKSHIISRFITNSNLPICFYNSIMWIIIFEQLFFTRTCPCIIHVYSSSSQPTDRLKVKEYHNNNNNDHHNDTSQVGLDYSLYSSSVVWFTRIHDSDWLRAQKIGERRINPERWIDSSYHDYLSAQYILSISITISFIIIYDDGSDIMRASFMYTKWYVRNLGIIFMMTRGCLIILNEWLQQSSSLAGVGRINKGWIIIQPVFKDLNK